MREPRRGAASSGAGGGARRVRRPRGRSGAGRPAARPQPSGDDRFGLLLLVLVGAYLISAFITRFWVAAIQLLAFLTVMWLALRSGRVRRRTVRLLLTVAVFGSAIALALTLTQYADVLSGVASLWTAFILLLAVAVIVRRVLAQRRVTAQSIYGAVSAYLIIGLMFSAIYGAMDKFGGNFFITGPDNFKTFQYFSFTTLTTLGYGDFTAAGDGGRAVAVMEALLGQVFLATLVARLVSSFRPPDQANRRRRPPRRGPPRERVPRRPATRRGTGGVRRTSSRARARPARRSPPRPGR